MRRIAACVGVLLVVAALGNLPSAGTDVAKLRPVELVCVYRQNALIIVQTDTENLGKGKTLEEALYDLSASSSADIFLETADKLLISASAADLLPELADHLRPACTVCLFRGEIDLKQAVSFLDHHEPQITLTEYRAGERSLETLTGTDGRMYLNESKINP